MYISQSCAMQKFEEVFGSGLGVNLDINYNEMPVYLLRFHSLFIF